MRDETRRRAKVALKDPARSVAAEEDTATRKSNKRGMPEAATRERRMTIMMTITSPPSMSFRRRQRSCVLMEVPRCIPPTANYNSGRVRLMQRNQWSTPRSH